VQSLDQDLPLSEVRTLTAAIERAQWYLWVFGTLFSVFAVIALVMAAIGIYAVFSHGTVQRTREIGVRMALGATSAKILGMVLERGAVQLGIGLTLGLLAASPERGCSRAYCWACRRRTRRSSQEPVCC
jgi:ABC-type antimicrobial peptide transport system permease subunit